MGGGSGGNTPDAPFEFSRNAPPFRRSFTVFFSNVTSWSNRVYNHFYTNSYDIVSVVEHHISVEKYPSLKNDAMSLGRDLYGLPAVPSGKSTTGTSAGLGILPKRELDVDAPEPHSLQLSMGLQDPAFARWYPLSVRLKGVTITYIVVYLYTSEGLSERNLDILHQLYIYI